MKVAGTLGNYLNQRVNVGGEEEEKKNSSPSRSSNKNDESMDSKCESTKTDTEIWDKSLFVGLNAKQKKNLRKKL